METEEIEDVLHPTPHHVGSDTEVLHRVGELVLDEVGDEACRRILTDEADDIGQLPR